MSRRSPREVLSSLGCITTPPRTCGVYVFELADGFFVHTTLDLGGEFVRSLGDQLFATERWFLSTDSASLGPKQHHIVDQLRSTGAEVDTYLPEQVEPTSTEFDSLCSTDEQQAWLAGATHTEHVRRADEQYGRGVHHRKLLGLSAHRYWPSLRDAMRSYVRNVLPKPEATVQLFWSAEVFPSPAPKNTTYLARLCVYWTPMFDAYATSNGPLCVLQASPDAMKLSLDASVRRRPSSYRSDGKAVALQVNSFEQAQQLIENPAVQSTLREWALHQLREGLSPFGAQHCPEFADQLLLDPPPEVPIDDPWNDEWPRVTHLAGFSHGRRYELLGDLRVGQALRLQREPENPRDPLAVRVYSNEGVHLGYIPADLAPIVSERLRKNQPIGCRIQRIAERTNDLERCVFLEVTNT